jgi:uncharacterized protein (DUF736 family)
MAEQSKDRLVLFRNEKKTKDNQPDMRGEFTLAGIEFEYALWKQTSKKGNEFYSGPITKKEEQETRYTPTPPSKEGQEVTSEDDIPF